MSHAANFMAGLTAAPKSTAQSLMVATDVIGGAVDTLQASGTHAFSIALVLALEMKKIADIEGWSESMQREFLSPAVLRLLDAEKEAPAR